jgi:hypothetical protein
MATPTKPPSGQQIQMIWIAFLASEACLVGIAEHVGHPPGASLTLFHYALMALVMAVASSGFILRQKVLGLSKAATDPVRAQKTWASAHLVSFAFAESVLLYGVVARLVAGAPRWLPPCFYAVSVLLLFLWRPSNSPDDRLI